MKQMSVIGINLETTKWIITSSMDLRNSRIPLCAYKCKTKEIANQIAESMKNSIEMDDTHRDETMSLYYLSTHGKYIVASMDLLENYFDGTIVDNGKREDFIYIVEDNDVIKEEEEPAVTFIVVNETKTSLTLKRKVVEEEEDLTDFSDEYLGATLYSKRVKTGAQITEGYAFNGLYFANNDFSVLWLPAEPYNGKAMFTAYGCPSNKVARSIETKIQQDGKNKLSVLDADEHVTMKCKGPILLASKEYLTQIYGEPTKISLVNDLAKQGLVDKYASDRKAHVAAIYRIWDSIAERKKFELMRQANRTVVNSHPNIAPRTNLSADAAVSAIRGNNISPQQPVPLPFGSWPPVATVWGSGVPIHTFFKATVNQKPVSDTVVPKPEPLPVPNWSRDLESVKNFVPTTQSFFTSTTSENMHIDENLINKSNDDELLKELTEEEYLSFFL